MRCISRWLVLSCLSIVGAVAVRADESLLAAVAEAADRRDPAAAVWTEAFASAEPAVLIAAARGYGRIGGDERLSALLPLLAHAEPAVRAEAAFAIGILDVQQAERQREQERALHLRLTLETELEVRVTLLQAIGNSGGEASQHLLREYPVASRPAAERAAWAQAVGLLWSYRRGALPAIDEALVKQLLGWTTRNEPVAEMAAFALARARKETLVQAQAKALTRAFGQSPSAGARIFLLRALSTTVSERNSASWLKAQQRQQLAGRKLNAAERIELHNLLCANLTGAALRTALATAIRQPAAAERLAAIQALGNRPAEVEPLRDLLQAHAALQPMDAGWLAPLLQPVSGAGDNSEEEANEPAAATPTYAVASAAVGKRYRLHTVRGPIDIELLPEARYTAANFAQLADKGFYNNSRFHRVIGNFVAQGGDPTGTGEGGPGWRIREELSRLPHAPGYLGMATAGKDTAGSQFFFNTGRNPHLDWHYTVFAKILAGDAIANQLLPGDGLLAVTRL